MQKKFKIGDKVQYTLEKATELEPKKNEDPLNDIYEITECKGSGGYFILNTSNQNKNVFYAYAEDLILIGSTPRHIERAKAVRPSKDQYYLNIAEQVSKRSTCLRRQYGAVIVKDDVIVSTGYNGSPRGENNCCDKGCCIRQIMNLPHNSGDYSECHSVHAEQNAIINAARQGSSIFGGTLYLYGFDYSEKEVIDASPCPICGRMLKNAGITQIVSSKKKDVADFVS